MPSLREWSEERELDWFLAFRAVASAVAEHGIVICCTFIRKNKAMYEQDTASEGFEWINANDAFPQYFQFCETF